jgi:hypothetical protein
MVLQASAWTRTRLRPRSPYPEDLPQGITERSNLADAACPAGPSGEAQGPDDAVAAELAG